MELLARLGIDWNSILLYLLNFGILALVVGYFVSTPILSMIDRRRKEIQDNLSEAEKIKKDFVEEQQKAQKEKVALRAEMNAQMEALHRDIHEKRKSQEEALSEKKNKMMEEIRTMVEEEKKALLKNAEKEVVGLMAKVIMNIVSNKIPEAVVKESVVESWKEYQQ